ncbi:MAG: GIY-YIG nuclease family protein [Candidatus Jorgensenbacteria bacterium]|nr:GIY-YIG nuclease family protein [Candidatus Jorgensenbacteria bacterium]
MKTLYEHIPETPGVYFMKNEKGEILYIGKAGNLKRRVSSYFLRPHDARIQKLVSLIREVDYKQTDTALEALILESTLIKKHEPPFNIREKDDKSFLYVVITDEEFPRVLLARGKNISEIKNKKKFGPFVSASSVREALRILRKIFPWHTHDPEKIGKYKKPCFDFEVGICPGVCINAISKRDYARTISKLSLFFSGKKEVVIEKFKKEMSVLSKKEEYESAEIIKRKIFALQHIQDTALINDDEIRSDSGEVSKRIRIEGYDISNISGTSAVGSMVVFTNNESDRNEYRKFKIQTVTGPNDIAMLREVLTRRFKNNWTLPDLILIDGGIGQVNVANNVLRESGLTIPVVGLAKGAERKKNELIGKLPSAFNIETLIKVRDEAHRFAISYHKSLRGRELFK